MNDFLCEHIEWVVGLLLGFLTFVYKKIFIDNLNDCRFTINNKLEPPNNFDSFFYNTHKRYPTTEERIRVSNYWIEVENIGDVDLYKFSVVIKGKNIFHKDKIIVEFGNIYKGGPPRNKPLFPHEIALYNNSLYNIAYRFKKRGSIFYSYKY